MSVGRVLRASWTVASAASFSPSCRSWRTKSARTCLSARRGAERWPRRGGGGFARGLGLGGFDFFLSRGFGLGFSASALGFRYRFLLGVGQARFGLACWSRALLGFLFGLFDFFSAFLGGFLGVLQLVLGCLAFSSAWSARTSASSSSASSFFTHP
jgi:hypothetical protein